MGIIIGTDEAGYGPNLGPLVISASVWQTPEGLRAADLYQRLAACVTAAAKTVTRRGAVPRDASAPGDSLTQGDSSRPIAIADSKSLYQPGGGLRRLERGVLAALGILGRRPVRWAEAWAALAPNDAAAWRSEPVHDGFDVPLPMDLPIDELSSATATLRAGLSAAGVELVALVSRPVFPAEFNALLKRHASKGGLLSRLTLELVRTVLAALPLTAVEVICDKHGGRNQYASLLSECFDVGLLAATCESSQQSTYGAIETGRRIEFTFSARAESYLPVALASMASKYLRELAMIALNRFWCGRVPGLSPTAGYPGDARRFRSAIAATQATLGIEDAALWRTK